MSDYAIKVSNVSKSYKMYGQHVDRLKEAFHPFRKKYHNYFNALTDISMVIPRGETIGVIGRNGSGKSTLLKIISGVLTPTSGVIEVNGRISALLELGAGFNPEMTGLENVYFQGMLLGFTKEQINNKLDDILSFADIGEFIHQPVKTYSSGMFVRLAFAVAVSIDPDILIVDEALSVGDATFQVKCMNRMKQFMNSGKTVLFVSHDPGAVKTLCKYAYLLDKGRLVYEGLPDKVFDYYNTLISLKAEQNLPLAEKMVERTGNGKVKIDNIYILNSSGNKTDTFVSGERISITLEVSAYDDVSGITFGIAIRDRLGNDIFGTNTYHLGVECSVSGGTRYSISFNLDLNLGVNIYQLVAAAHTDQHHLDECFDWINNAFVFNVIESPDYRFIGYCRLKPESIIDII